MKVTELRIGNFVKTATPNMEIVIPHVEAKVQAISLFGEVTFNNEPTNNNGFEMHCKHIVGIPLTEEWLLKFGFRKLDKYSYVKNGFFIHKRKIGFIFNVGRKKVDIKFVHVLQNTYFCIEQKEII